MALPLESGEEMRGEKEEGGERQDHDGERRQNVNWDTNFENCTAVYEGYIVRLPHMTVLNLDTEQTRHTHTPFVFIWPY